MPLSYADGTIAEHKACRTGRGRVRRQPPRHRPGAGTGCARPPAGRAHQRPRQDRAGPGAVHPPARRRRRVGARRHHRVVDRRRACSTSCPTRRTPSGWSTAIGGEDVTADAGDHRRPGTGGPRPAGHGRPGGGRHRPLPRRHRVGRGRPSARWPARATRARTASSSPSRPSAPPLVWEALLGIGVVPAGLGARDTLAPRGGAAAARPRARPRHHAAAGRPRVGRGLGQAERLPRSGRAGRRARPRRGSEAPGPGRRGTPTAPRRAGRAGRRATGRRGHQRQLLAGARPRHRAGVPAPRGGGGSGGRHRRPWGASGRDRRHRPPSWADARSRCG